MGIDSRIIVNHAIEYDNYEDIVKLLSNKTGIRYIVNETIITKKTANTIKRYLIIIQAGF